MTAYQKENLAAMKEYRQGLNARGNFRPSGSMTMDNHPILTDTRTGDSIDAITGEPVAQGTKVMPLTRGSAGSGGVWKVKHDAWLTSHPDDEQGALEYAAGHRQMNASDLNKTALSMAQRDVANDMTLMGKPADQRAQVIQQRAAEYSRLLQQGFGTTPAPAAPAGAPAAAPAASTVAPKPVAQGKPPIVKQNGHLYKLQPDGSYVAVQ